MVCLKRFGFFLISVFAASMAIAQAEGDSLSRYQLGIGDVISIVVFGEDDLKREKIRLSDAGTIYYPMLGELKVVGRTTDELEKLIAEGLRGRYLVNPRVSVTVDQYRPYFINGQVGHTGAFPYQPGLNIRKAVVLAGGFKDRANKDKIFIVRDKEKGSKPVKADLDTAVYPGDTITVEESFF